MPFSNPPVPFSFDVGQVPGAHIHMDTSGLYVYDASNNLVFKQGTDDQGMSVGGNISDVSKQLITVDPDAMPPGVASPIPVVVLDTKDAGYFAAMLFAASIAAGGSPPTTGLLGLSTDNINRPSLEIGGANPAGNDPGYVSLSTAGAGSLFMDDANTDLGGPVPAAGGAGGLAFTKTQAQLNNADATGDPIIITMGANGGGGLNGGLTILDTHTSQVMYFRRDGTGRLELTDGHGNIFYLDGSSGIYQQSGVGAWEAKDSNNNDILMSSLGIVLACAAASGRKIQLNDGVGGQIYSGVGGITVQPGATCNVSIVADNGNGPGVFLGNGATPPLAKVGGGANHSLVMHGTDAASGHWISGDATAVTLVGGQATITHHLGRTPQSVVCNVLGLSSQVWCTVGNINSTTFDVAVWTASGAATGSRTIHWQCFA